MDDENQIPEFQMTYRDESDGLIPLRKRYADRYLDTKSYEGIIREEDIQILCNWRSLTGIAPGEVHQTDYRFGLENIEGWDSPRGLPWWKLKTSGKDRRAVRIKECRAAAHNTENEQLNLQWILIQNQQEPLEMVPHESRLVVKL